MKTQGHDESLSAAKGFMFLVLVPHRDARLPLRAWSGALFAAGFPGAWSFPWAAPLAVLSHPLDADELKRCARILREQTAAEGGEGKIKTGQVSRAALPDTDAAVFGPLLNCAIPAGAFTPRTAAKIAHCFLPVVLGAALVRSFETAAAPEPPALSFRAAALANMVYRPLPGKNTGHSFEWKLGKLCWLPR